MRVEDQTHRGDRGPERSVRRRRLLPAGALALSVAACALVGGGLSPQPALAKKPPRLIHNHSGVGVGCVTGPANTVRTQIRVRMSVVNYDGLGDWADHMEAKVRLEPTTAGLNFTRSWRSVKTPYLIQNKRHAYTMTPLSDNLSGTADWRVHVKLIWHRPFPIKNITKNLYLPFNASCAIVGGETAIPNRPVPTGPTGA